MAGVGSVQPGGHKFRSRACSELDPSCFRNANLLQKASKLLVELRCHGPEGSYCCQAYRGVAMQEAQIILNLHGIGTPERVLEPGEEPYWLSVEQFQDIVSFAASMRGKIKCAFTIDDSNLSDATIAGPFLARMGFSAQIFVLTGRIGQKGSLDQIAIRDLLDMGHTIGSHGNAHRDWKTLDEGELVDEIHTPRKRLQDLTGQTIDAAGLPFGGYNREVLAEARRAGFKRLYSSDGGIARNGDWPAGRTSLRRDMSSARMRALFDPEPLFVRLKRRIKAEIKKRL